VLLLGSGERVGGEHQGSDGHESGTESSGRRGQIARQKCSSP
jgi:hypothetical protein